MIDRRIPIVFASSRSMQRMHIGATIQQELDRAARGILRRAVKACRRARSLAASPARAAMSAAQTSRPGLAHAPYGCSDANSSD
jgi:hypothetical protein